MEPTVVLTL